MSVAPDDLLVRPDRDAWARLRAAQGRRSLGPDGRPTPLLAYQSRAVETVATRSVTVYEKSRRTGVTWSSAALAVPIAAAAREAGGMDVIYVGYNLDMAREFISDAGDWALKMHGALAPAQEFIFDDGAPEKQIKAYRIAFPSGFEICALSSKPRSFRGRQGFAIIDEASFHDDLQALIEAALALIMWGGKVLVISTHFGRDNYFNQLIENIRAGRRPYALLRTDFDEALQDGLYERVCAKSGKTWTPEGEADYRAEVIGNYGDAADEELYCIPAEGAGAWLPATLIEARQDATIPVLRWDRPSSFVDLAPEQREAAAREWCETVLEPALAGLDATDLHALGGDFGRFVDLSVFWVMATLRTMKRATRLVVELRNTPFEQQRQILHYLMDRIPRLSAAHLDAGGSGAWLAEVTGQRYGTLVAQVKFSVEWYRTEMPPLKAAFEDATLTIPADRDQYEDLRLVTLVKGVAMIPKRRTTGKDGGKRHGDAAVALALAYSASRARMQAYGYLSAKSLDDDDDGEDDVARDRLGGDRRGRLG